MDLLWIAKYFLFVATLCECVYGQRRGSWGQHRRPPRQCELPNGESGICIPIDNCRKALAQIRKNINPTICHFHGRYPFVCCKRRRHAPVAESGSKSQEKCEEYKNINTEEQQFFVPAVVGGVDSLAKEFPHMAALGYGNEADIQWNCGGSLISDQFVLTAGHCLYPQALGEVQYVRLGDLNLDATTDESEPQDFKVIQRIPHPDYSPPSQYNDIGLVQLDRPVKYSTYVKPACLQIGNDLNDTLAIATGWGALEFGGGTSDHLQKVYLRYFTNEQCQITYAADSRLQRSIVDDLQLCAGGIDEEKDTCQGDSGGPLQIKTTIGIPTYYIIGVTSFGKGCGVANTPGVYTRVSNYVPWIEQVVWPN